MKTLPTGDYDIKRIQTTADQFDEKVAKAEQEHTVISFEDIKTQVDVYRKRGNAVMEAYQKGVELNTLIKDIDRMLSKYRHPNSSVAKKEIMDALDTSKCLEGIESIEKEYNYTLTKFRKKVKDLEDSKEKSLEVLEDRYEYERKQLGKALDKYEEDIVEYENCSDQELQGYYEIELRGQKEMDRFNEKYPHIDILELQKRFEDLKKRENAIHTRKEGGDIQKETFKKIETDLQSLVRLFDSFPQCLGKYAYAHDKFNEEAVKNAYDKVKEMSAEDIGTAVEYMSSPNLESLISRNGVLTNLDNLEYAKKFKKGIKNIFDEEEVATNKLISYFDLFKKTKSLLFKDSSALESIIEYADRKLGILKEESANKVSQSAVSGFHAENAGKIFFTKNLNLDVTSATENDFQTSFNLGDDIMAVVFLNDVYKETINGIKAPSLNIDSFDELDEPVSGEYINRDLEAYYDNSYLTFVLSSSVENYKDENPLYFNTLGIMKHTFLGAIYGKGEVSFTFNKGKANEAKSNFQLDATSNVQEFKDSIEKIESNIFNSKEIAQPGPLHTDELEAQVLKSFNNENASVEYIRVIFTSNEWTVARNEFGIEVGRTAMAKLYIIFNDGKCNEFYWTLLQELGREGYGGFKVWSRTGGSYFPKEKLLAARKQ